MSEVPEDKKKHDAIRERKSRKSRSNSAHRNNKDSLPWWIELLFVQIGLPEKLLLNLLKINKSLQKTIKDNRDYSKLGFILLVLIFYSLPILNQAKNMNTCIRERSLILKNKGVDNNEIISSSVHYCNGGDSTSG